MKHASHPAIMARLKRAAGHVTSIVAMIEEKRSCLDIAQQLHAAEKAIANAKRELIHDHIEHCLEDGGETHASLKELKELTKYL